MPIPTHAGQCRVFATTNKTQEIDTSANAADRKSGCSRLTSVMTPANGKGTEAAKASHAEPENWLTA